MGRITGFFSGFTLTSVGLYFSLLAHQRNRSRQAVSLSQQALLLNSIVDPTIVPEEDVPRFVLQRASWSETWKDRWNAEVEGAVRWLQDIRMDDVRAAASGTWRSFRETESRSAKKA